MAKKKKPLKKSLSGQELEFFVLNSKGEMVNEAAKLIKAAEKRFPNLRINAEAGQNMFELASFPAVNVMDTSIDLINKVKMMMDVALANDYHLYPNATYPGVADPQITKKKKYLEQLAIFGEDRAKQAALVCGFHYHYTLPKGVYDSQKKFLKQMISSKMKQSMMDSYNLSIAFDPALTCFMQSSPFVQGEYLAKDSRIMIYRGGKKLGYEHGKYSKHQSLGGLPPYKQTLNDLMFSLKRRQQRYKEEMEKKGLNPKNSITEDNVLDFTWNPVRINKLGTLELRGMDMNHPRRTMAMASLLKFVFRAIYRDGYHVMPSDIGLHEPFKIEGNFIHIPPHTHVRNHLQKEATYYGFESSDAHSYTKRMYKLCKQFLEDDYLPVVKPLQEEIENKESVSDIILKRLKKWGYGKDDQLPNDIAAESALKSCENFVDELEKVEDVIEKI